MAALILRYGSILASVTKRIGQTIYVRYGKISFDVSFPPTILYLVRKSSPELFMFTAKKNFDFQKYIQKKSMSIDYP